MVKNSLTTLLTYIQTYFDQRIIAEDLESFTFCFHRIFNSIDTLYLLRLPDLAVYTNRLNTLANIQAQIDVHYHIWLCLQATKQQLERLEAHCQLATNLTFALLTALSLEEPPINTQELLYQHIITQEEWERELTVITERSNDWLQSHHNCPPLIAQFPHIPAMLHGDTALDALLDNACAIFSDIFADFRTLTPGDDETLATLLLDIMQKVDLILLQVDIVLEQLYPLLKQFTVNTDGR